MVLTHTQQTSEDTMYKKKSGSAVRENTLVLKIYFCNVAFSVIIEKKYESRM